MSVVEAFLDSVHSISPELKPLLLKNIVLTGGSSAFQGFASRFMSEAQSGVLLPLTIRHSLDTSLYIHSLQSFAESYSFFKNSIQKKVYEEFGSYALTSILNL